MSFGMLYNRLSSHPHWSSGPMIFGHAVVSSWLTAGVPLTQVAE
ncbi:hypothetical protein J2S53_000512 [Actinopolyspora lacussalsi]|nr:hypothetical protein [Actinopolyspora lacussalsi]